MKYASDKARLRPVRAADAKITVQWRNDPDVRDFALGYRYPVTLAMERKWYAQALTSDGKDAHFAVEDVVDGRLVGIVSLVQIDLISKNACFGIVMGDKKRQGRGIGTDATRVVVQYGFDMLNLNRIYLLVPAYNARAKSVYRKIGFVREGVMRRHVFMNGRYHDVEVMGLMAREFKRLA